LGAARAFSVTLLQAYPLKLRLLLVVIVVEGGVYKKETD
jgi:hypothetical protein